MFVCVSELSLRLVFVRKNDDKRRNYLASCNYVRSVARSDSGGESGHKPQNDIKLLCDYYYMSAALLIQGSERVVVVVAVA